MKYLIFALLATSIFAQGRPTSHKCPDYCVGCARTSTMEQGPTSSSSASTLRQPGPTSSASKNLKQAISSSTASTLKQGPTSSSSASNTTPSAYKCQGCLGRFTAGTRLCQTTPRNDNCAVYQNGNHCAICKKGYALSILHSKQNNLAQTRYTSCVKLTIPRCVYGYAMTNSEGRLAQGPGHHGQKCFVCENGYPSADYKKCEGWTTQNNFVLRRLRQQPANHANCEWGMRNNVANDVKKTCVKCADGYVVDSVRKICVRSTLKGCLEDFNGDNEKCGTCDVLSGYWNKTPTTCTKEVASIF